MKELFTWLSWDNKDKHKKNLNVESQACFCLASCTYPQLFWVWFSYGYLCYVVSLLFPHNKYN